MRVARWLLYATLAVPVLVFPGFLFPFVTIRAVYFRVLVEIASGILLYLVLRRDVRFAFRGDMFFWALVAWVAANALAAVFGVAPMRSMFGDHERMGGVWFWLHLLAYYLTLRTFLDGEHWWRFLRIAVSVAAAVAVYGLVQFWLHPFDFVIGGLDTGVTVGNSGLLAAYLLANITFCVLLALRGGTRARVGYVALALLLASAIVVSGNRSSTLALLLGAGVAFVALTVWSGSLRSWRTLLSVVLLLGAASLPFIARASWARPVTTRVPVLRKLAAGVDRARLIQWQAAVEGIRERPLLGVGPENYQVIWARYYHPEMHRFVADSRWDRAHNAYLDAFATAGVFGFLSLLALWLAIGWSIVRVARHGEDTTGWPPGATMAVVGFSAAYAFYLLFWFFDLNSTMLWVALAALVTSRASGAPLIVVGAAREKRWQSTMVLALGATALVSAIYVHGFETLRMARTLSNTRDPSQPLHETLADFESVFASPAPVTQHAFLLYAGRLRDLYPRFAEIRSDPVRADVFNRAFLLAVREFERQAEQDPLNERLLVQHARVLMLGAAYYNSAALYESALTKLNRAVELAPRRVNTLLVLGVAYLNANRPADALRAFQRAYAADPASGQTQSYLATAHAALRDYRSAAFWMRSAMANGFMPDREDIEQTVEALASSGEPGAAAELALHYLRERVGTPFVWVAQGFIAPDEAVDRWAARRATDQVARAADDTRLARRAARLLDLAGDSGRAEVVRSAVPVLCVRPVHLRRLAAQVSRPGGYVRVPACREPWRLGDVHSEWPAYGLHYAARSVPIY